MKKEPPAGYIFLCSDATEQECLDKNLFGGQNKYEGRVRGLMKGNALFLYNYQSKKLHGIFIAESEVLNEIIPAAWGGVYPVQVKVRRTEIHAPISREDLGKDVLKFDMRGRPSSRLDSSTVKNLEKIFRQKKRVKTYADDTPFFTNDGHKVKSKAELAIDNWLFANRIAHGYDVAIPGSAKRCDFKVLLKDGDVYIEYWGLNDKTYLRNKNEKLKLYNKGNLKLLELTSKDNLVEVLEKKLKH